MRAGPHCDEETIDVVSPLPAVVGATYSSTPPPATPVDPPEPKVYADLFQVGAMPSEICTLHDPAAHTIEGSTTPVIDSLLQAASYTTPAVGAAIRMPATRLYVDRVPQGDGSVRTVVRER
jgi:hypothetical protein